jgi:hypothetical protein
VQCKRPMERSCRADRVEKVQQAGATDTDRGVIFLFFVADQQVQVLDATTNRARCVCHASLPPGVQVQGLQACKRHALPHCKHPPMHPTHPWLRLTSIGSAFVHDIRTCLAWARHPRAARQNISQSKVNVSNRSQQTRTSRGHVIHLKRDKMFASSAAQMTVPKKPPMKPSHVFLGDSLISGVRPQKNPAAQ